jgi:hypothetical protein
VTPAPADPAELVIAALVGRTVPAGPLTSVQDSLAVNPDGSNSPQRCCTRGRVTVESLEQRLLRNAYLFEDPRSYQAGVRDTLAMFEHSGEESRAEAEEAQSSR